MKSNLMKKLATALVALVALAYVAVPLVADAQQTSVMGKGSDGMPRQIGAEGDRLKTDSVPKIVTPDGGLTEARGSALGAQHVEVTNSGQSPLPVYSPVCSSTSQSVVVVGVTPVTVPTTALPGRKSLRVCVSLENVGSPKVKCALDTTPVMGFVETDAGTPIGDVLQPGDCFGYSVDTTHSVKCISDTASTGVVTYECS